MDRSLEPILVAWGFGFRGLGVGLGVSDFGIRTSGFGFRAWGFGSRASDYGIGLRVTDFGVRVSGFGIRASGLGSRVSGPECRGSGLRSRVWGQEANRGAVARDVRAVDQDQRPGRPLDPGALTRHRQQHLQKRLPCHTSNRGALGPTYDLHEVECDPTVTEGTRALPLEAPYRFYDTEKLSFLPSFYSQA